MITHKEISQPPEYRCTCGKLLGKGFVNSGALHIKCRACKSFILIGDANAKHPCYLVDVLHGVSFADVNDEACSLLRYTREELLSMRVDDVWPAFRAGAYNHFWHSQFGDFQKGFHVKTVIESKDGQSIPVRATTKAMLLRTNSKVLVLRDEQARIYKQLKPDILEARKRNWEEEDVSVINRTHRAIWNTAGVFPFMLAVVEPLVESAKHHTKDDNTFFSFAVDAIDGTCISASSGAKYILGRGENEFLGKKLDEFLFQSNDRIRYQKAIQNVSTQKDATLLTLNLISIDNTLSKHSVFLRLHKEGLFQRPYFEVICLSQ